LLPQNPLEREIWFDGNCYFKYHGDAEGHEDTSNKYPSGTLDAVKFFLSKQLTPILVFTMTKLKAVELAEEFSKLRKQDVNSYVLSEKLELFSEPTSLSKKLKFISEKKIAFHSADLSFSERNVVEEALRERSLDVVFSTPTLAAGVNFPLRTVIFDSFNRHWEANPWISKSEYLNMSGRAGRLGFHDEGSSVLLPKNIIEFDQAKKYISEEQKPLESVLMNKSIRKNILNLITSQFCDSLAGITEFYEQTFWWYQTLDRNPKLIEKVPPKIEESVTWLADNDLITLDSSKLLPTRLGIAISATGLLPSTGVYLLNIIGKNQSIFNTPNFKLPLLHAICASDEFQENIGQRYLPYARRNQPETKAWQIIKSCSPLINPNDGKHVDRIINAAYGINLWCKGVKEHTLREELPSITYGQFHTLSTDISWVLEGISKIIRMSELKIDLDIATKIEILSDSVRLGVPSELLDIMKAAKESDVPGFGRHRAMELFEKGLYDPNLLLQEDFENVKKAVDSKRRAEALLDAVAIFFPNKLLAWKNRHIRRVGNIGRDYKIIENSYDQTGTDYEESIKDILTFLDWDVKPLDRSKRQGVPDLLLVFKGESILIECKTKNKQQATIDKEDAFAILTKGIDINADHYVTLGKPDFGTFCKEKASSSNKITLLPHYSLIEAIIQFWEGKQSTESIFKWLMIPGVASLTTLDSLAL
jgi:helicase